MTRSTYRLALAAFVALTPLPASALTIVNTLYDAVDAAPGDGVCDADTTTPGLQCTLRAALMHAPNNEVIRLAQGRHMLSIPKNAAFPDAQVGDLNIEGKTLTLEAMGVGRPVIAAEAGLLDGALSVRSGNVILRNVEIEGPYQTIDNRWGGGIACGNGTGTLPSTLLLENVRVHGFWVEGSGGGLYTNVNCTLTLRRVEVHDNRADGHGGGIYFYTDSARTFEFDQIAVWNNSAGQNGGGIYRGNYLTTFKLSNATLTGNAAQNGAALFLFQVGVIELRNVTITGNGGPNHQGDVAEYAVEGPVYGDDDLIANSIIAGNTGVSAKDMSLWGTLVSHGHNLFGSYDSTIGVITVQASDQHGVADPQLAPLSIAAGSATGLPTRPPLPGSPAIDAGHPSAPSDATFERCRQLDANGVARVAGQCDIGAAEAVDGDLLFANDFEL